MAMMLIRRSLKSGKQTRWHNTTSIMHLRDIQLPALMLVLPVLVVLPRLPVNQHHRLRLPPRYHFCLHAQSVDPICTCALRSLGLSIYVDLVAVVHGRLLNDAVTAELNCQQIAASL